MDKTQFVGIYGSLCAVRKMFENQIEKPRMYPNCHHTNFMIHDGLYEEGLRAINVLTGLVQLVQQEIHGTDEKA